MAKDELPPGDPARDERAGGANEGRDHDQPGGPDELGATRQRPRPDQTAPLQEYATGRAPGPATDGTALLPPTAREPPRWSARAHVPTPGMADESVTEWPGMEPPRRGMLLPLLISVAAVLLIGLIALGIWLGLRAADNEPVVPASPAPASSAQVTTATSPPAPPATQPPATQPATVQIPTLSGLSYEDALALLPPHVAPNRIDESHPSIPAGVVIRTNPGAGSEVSVPVQIDIVVSSGPPRESPSPAPTAASTPVTPTSAPPADDG